MSAKYDVLAWNQLATYFIGDLSGLAVEDRNMIRWMFSGPIDDIDDTDQRLIVYVAAPGSPAREAFRRLATREPEPSGPHVRLNV